MKSFKELIVWQKSMDVAQLTYDICGQLPKDEMFGLSSQMKRCAVSIPSNIAEGFKRRNKKELVQFLHISLGSAAELETQLLLSSRLFSLDIDNSLALLTEVEKMLTSLIRKTNEP